MASHTVLREFRLFYRRVLSSIEESSRILESAEELSEVNSNILSTNINEIKANQEKLDALVVESFSLSLSEAEEKEFERVNAMATQINVIVGRIRSAQAKLLEKNDRLMSNADSNLTNRQSWASSTSHSNSPFNSSSMMHSKLPKIHLPSFDGDEQKFLNYKSQFLRLVHNNREVELEDKMVYLKSSLTGKAERLIRDIPTSAENYYRAWDAITERYEDKFLIVESHFHELFAIQRIKTSREIRELIDSVDSVLRSLELSGESFSGWPGIITYFVYTKLDDRTQLDWKKTITDHSKYPTWETLRKFLKTNAVAFRPLPVNDHTKKESKPVEAKKSCLVASKSNCIVCNRQHLIIECDAFQAKPIRDRISLIRQHRLCPNCFNFGHNSYQCKSRKVCKICSRKHHTLLHLENSTSNSENKRESPIEKVVPKQPDPTKSETQGTQASAACLNAVTDSEKTVILPSAVLQFECHQIQGFLRILLDTCSQVTLVTDSFVRRFKISAQPSPNPISVAVGAVKATTTRQCSLRLHSQFTKFTLDIDAEVVPSNALRYEIRNLDWLRESQDLKSYELADGAFSQKIVNIPSVDLILGAAYLPKVLLSETKRLHGFLMQQTAFGWTILGSSSTQSGSPVQILPKSDRSCLLSIQEIDDRLQQFWESEEPLALSNKSKLSEEHEACSKHFEQTYTRLENGKFQVRLPLKLPKEELINNYSRALACLRRAETSSSEPKATMYKNFMKEYQTLDHMSQIATPSPSDSRYFLPHHAVLRPTSTTTKLRVVFNASSKTASGKSLNDILMMGPVVQPELFDILVNFRAYPVAFTADITKMYRCIEVHPSDRSLQSILWRDDPSNQPQVFELNTVTYGTAPASFIATKCLQVLGESAPEEAVRTAIQSCFYMDDLLAGAASITEAKALQKSVHDLCESAHLSLRKYQSNLPELLQNIPTELVESELTRTIGGYDAISILGMYWTPTDDCFRIKVPDAAVATEGITKRRLLSEVAKIFDPLGFIAPITVREKMFIQSLWQQGLSWDQEVPAPMIKEFCAFHTDMQLLQSFAIPRPYSLQCLGEFELIGFCDSSLKAYCAVIYIRAINGSGVQSVRFLCAKTRVAPIKPLTIPKLELCAAVLLSELLHRVRQSLRLNIVNIFAFSDSQVVLSWLAKSPETWKVYVANRVQKIVSAVPFQNWGYVSTSENPADLATRNCTINSFLKSDLWVNGPLFLSHPINLSDSRIVDPNLDLEKRKPKVLCNFIIYNLEFFINFINRFSCFRKLIRTFAYILLYFRNLKTRTKSESPSKLNKTIYPVCLTVTDLIESEFSLIRRVQQSFYPKDYARLSENKPLSKRSILKSHNPFIDSKGVIRLATRLFNAPVSYDRKNPIVLPSNSHFVKLLVRHVHLKYFHATRSFIFAHLSVRYHFTGSLTNVIKYELHQCVICARYRVEVRSQIMGDLPTDRCTVSRPFTATGVDFAGPFLCKPMVTRSKVRFKVYAAVYVCFATRAVHLELASSLSAEDFLSTLHRFVSRRGLPKVIYSDNGTNFRGASKFVNLRDESIQNYCASEGISWRFNPPRAPNRGGLWEAAVKSMKYHLVRVTKDQILNYEQYTTLLHRIESILNSRPLCYKPGDPASIVLTSGHFLIGDQLTSLPETESTSIKLSKRYEFARRQITSFWHLWSKDYLSQLQTRVKWHKTKPNVKVGQVVILKNDLSKPAQWDLALIVETFPDSHGIIRTVKVRHGSSEKIRAISSVVPLPTDD